MLFLVVICLGGFVLKPTLAKFTSSYTTDEDVVGLNFDFDIGISNIEEYNELKVLAGEYEIFNVEITNSSSDIAYYGVWYRAVSPSELSSDVTIARLDGTETTTSGSIDNGTIKTVTIIVINNSDDDLTIDIGVLSDVTSVDNIEYLNGRKLVSGTAEKPFDVALASNYIMNLYNDGSTINTTNVIGDTSKSQVSLNESQSIMLDDNGDYRYYGKSPNNYVSYNGELWRIISVSNVKSSTSDTVGETRVKIIKATTLVDDNGNENFVWDSGELNDWSKSSLMTQLNTLYYNSGSGTCYVNSNESASCDFTDTGLSSEAQGFIDNALYYLGGIPELYPSFTADEWYDQERTETVYGENSSTWVGKVGIMYASDYAYATNFTTCSNYDYAYSGCSNNDWLYAGGSWIWFINHYSGYDYRVLMLYVDSFFHRNSYKGASLYLSPVVYLKSNVLFVGGSGTSDKPYQLSLSTT